MDNPLFIPLNTEHYEAFEDGSKITEYRIHGKRWHRGTVWVGRAVTLSKGYGKQNRLSGVVNKVEIKRAIEVPSNIQSAILGIYGMGNHEMICISIDLPDVPKSEGE